MYTTCLFCQSDLGRNESIEAFPVGRRPAYDQAKGRLWVVCRKCERWNLTPQEERWEAMEQAERLYRGTRLRASTDNVGLARLRDGTELVRIGQPLRPEFAAWRYGDQFGRRRRRQALYVGGAVAALGAIAVAGPVLGLFSLGGLSQLPNIINVANLSRMQRTKVWLEEGPGNAALHVNLLSARQVRLASDAEAGFALLVPQAHDGGSAWGRGRNMLAGEPVRLTGPRALAAASRLLPRLNTGGGSAGDVRSAVDLLDRAGSSQALFDRMAVEARRHRSPWRGWNQQGTRGRQAALVGEPLGALTAPVRLALEMAAQEEQERRALQGELRELETAWQQAEEIAAIADNLLLPEGVDAKLGQLKASNGRSSARTGAPSSPTSDSGAASSS